MKTLVCMCLLATVSLPALASTMDGNQLLEKCRFFFRDELPPASPPQRELLDTGYCAGYFDGILDTHALLFTLDKSDHVQGRKRYCRPEEVTNGQVTKVVKKWLDTNPEKLHYSGETIIFLAMVDAFPCR